MTAATGLDRAQLDRVRAVAAVLLPGSAESPDPTALPEFDDLVQTAAVAMGVEHEALTGAIGAVPAAVSWANLAGFAELDPAAFELVSLLVVGAYFMSPTVLASLRIPVGERKPARPEQVVDELSSGILDAVHARGCPVRTLADVNRQAGAE